MTKEPLKNYCATRSAPSRARSPLAYLSDMSRGFAARLGAPRAARDIFQRFPREPLAKGWRLPSALKLWNFFQFQVGWFALVLGAAQGYPWLGAAVALALLAVNLRLDSLPWREGSLLLAVGFVGWLWESLLHGAGLVRFNPGAGPHLFGWMAPLWMAVLWMNFASTLNVSLAWLQGRHRLAALCGAVGGPLAFFAGEKLGAITLVEGWLTLGVLGLAWLLFTPLLLWAAPRWRRVAVLPGDRTTVSVVAGEVRG